MMEHGNRTLRLAAAQLAGSDRQLPSAGVVERMVTILDKAADEGAELLAYPELALTSYFARDPYPGAESARHWFQDLPDDLTAPLFERADMRNVDIVVPFAEWASGARYNSALVWKAGTGSLGSYRKVHTPPSVTFQTNRVASYEADWFSRGDAFPTFDLGNVRVGVEICYDRHFPESTRELALGGAEVVVLVSNSQSYGTSWRAEMWDVLCRSRAYENALFLLAANKSGPEEDSEWHGRSCVVSPRGEILAMEPQSNVDSFVCTEIDLDAIGMERRTRSFLEQRQPHAYPSSRHA